MKDWDKLLEPPKEGEERIIEKLKKFKKKIEASPEKLGELAKEYGRLIDKANKKGYRLENIFNGLPFSLQPVGEKWKEYRREKTKSRYKIKEVLRIIEKILDKEKIVVIKYNVGAGRGRETKEEYAIFGTKDIEGILDAVGNEARDKLKEPPKTYENGIHLKTEPEGFTWTNIEKYHKKEVQVGFVTNDRGWGKVLRKLRRNSGREGS